MFYDVFLLGYVNGLQSYLHVSEKRPRLPGNRAVSTPNWRMALEEAKIGLAKHRMAAELARGGKHSDAETVANEALKHIEKRLVSRSIEFVSG